MKVFILSIVLIHIVNITTGYQM
ncbi:hypothetical protein TSMEX_011103 [Taenia solium]|eukprot:TsM_000027200 transcript=TsM_000027200 gene=TsM_000027200